MHCAHLSLSTCYLERFLSLSMSSFLMLLEHLEALSCL